MGVIQDWVKAAEPVFNLGRIRAGNTLTLVRDAGGALKALSYQIDANHRLWLRAVPVKAAGPEAGASAATGASPQWKATIETIPYETRVEAVTGTVQSSLFQAVEDSGEQDALALEMANIFGWDLDFYTDPQPGDVFRVLVEKKYINGKFSQYGQIVAAEYVNAGHKYDAVRFHDAEGVLAYYTPNGQPMKREFLRSPLKFVTLRVTSGFSRDRYHPILKRYRAHLGVDYGAPMGTPVQTIGSGVVIHAGRKGQDGNMVEIRHTDGYDTFYLHLSKILVRNGEHVTQGQTIGKVGMTGLATGPHLDFRIEHNGRFEDFERVRKTLPPAQPVEAKLMPQFKRLSAEYMPELAALNPAAAPAPAEAATNAAPPAPAVQPAP
jgi:murein DD-endopeptidase MepM/ murein hydrolase activator NlpD